MYCIIFLTIGEVIAETKEQYSTTSSAISAIVVFVSDDYLYETVLAVYLERVTFLLTALRDVELEKQIKHAGQILWDLFKRSSHHLKQKFANDVGDKPQFIAFTIKGMCICLRSYGKSL